MPVSRDLFVGHPPNVIVEASVHSVDLNPGKGVSNWVLPGYVADGVAVLENCQ